MSAATAALRPDEIDGETPIPYVDPIPNPDNWIAADPDADLIVSAPAPAAPTAARERDLIPGHDYQIHPAMQPRQGMDPAWIETIRHGLEAGRPQDRLLLADITDPDNAPADFDPARPVLVDGHHRHEAIQSLKRDHARVTIERMTWGAALIRAGSENGANGQPLDDDGIREWARRLWLFGRKSQSGIARTVGKSPATITRWVQAWETGGDERERADAPAVGRPREEATAAALLPDVRRELSRLGSLAYQIEICQKIADAATEAEAVTGDPTQIPPVSHAASHLDQIGQRIRKRHNPATLIAAIQAAGAAMIAEAAAVAAQPAPTTTYTGAPAPVAVFDVTQTMDVIRGIASRNNSSLTEYGRRLEAATVEHTQRAAAGRITPETFEEARRRLREIWIEEVARANGKNYVAPTAAPAPSPIMPPPAWATNGNGKTDEEIRQHNEEISRAALESDSPAYPQGMIRPKTTTDRSIAAGYLLEKIDKVIEILTGRPGDDPSDLYLELTGSAEWRRLRNNKIMPELVAMRLPLSRLIDLANAPRDE